MNKTETTYKAKYEKYKGKYLKLSRELTQLQDGGAGFYTKRTKTMENTKPKPKISTSDKYIDLEFKGVQIAQVCYDEGPCGLTFLYFPCGVRTHMEVRGGYSAYTSVLGTECKHKMYGLAVVGCSSIGLEAISGITAESFKQNNYRYWKSINGAAVYTRSIVKNAIYPDINLGRYAYDVAANNPAKRLYSGQVGAGLKAQHGVGWAYKKLDGKFDNVEVFVMIVNNAIGDVYKGDKLVHKHCDFTKKDCDKIEAETLHKLNKCKDNICKHNAKRATVSNNETCNKCKRDNIKPVEHGCNKQNCEMSKNTTIILVATNLDLSISHLEQMNNQMNVAIGEAIKPFNTFQDGDVFYTCSTMRYVKEYKTDDLIDLFEDFSNVMLDAVYNSVGDWL